MKAERTHDYAISRLRQDPFIKHDAGSGHVVYRVIWTRAGESIGQAIDWLQPGQKPTTDLALFYCKLACAKGMRHDGRIAFSCDMSHERTNESARTGLEG